MKHSQPQYRIEYKSRSNNSCGIHLTYDKNKENKIHAHHNIHSRMHRTLHIYGLYGIHPHIKHVCVRCVRNICVWTPYTTTDTWNETDIRTNLTYVSTVLPVCICDENLKLNKKKKTTNTHTQTHRVYPDANTFTPFENSLKRRAEVDFGTQKLKYKRDREKEQQHIYRRSMGDSVEILPVVESLCFSFTVRFVQHSGFYYNSVHIVCNQFCFQSVQ